MIAWIPLVVAAAGFGLSWYAYHVEQFAGKKKGYHASCDFGEHSLCTKAFLSAYGKTFGVSNGTWGILFYLVAVILALLGEIQYLFLISSLSLLASLYLAYALYVKVKTFCVVCTSIYVVNILLVISTYFLGF